MKHKTMNTENITETDKSKTDLEIQITYDYYKQQRDEFINLSRERISITLQFLVLLGALGAAFLQTNFEGLKFGISLLIVLLGVLGFYILKGTQKTMRLHVLRARAARKAVGFLEQFSNVAESEISKIRGARNDTFYYDLIYLLIIMTGLIFGLTVFLK